MDRGNPCLTTFRHICSYRAGLFILHNCKHLEGDKHIFSHPDCRTAGIQHIPGFPDKPCLVFKEKNSLPYKLFSKSK